MINSNKKQNNDYITMAAMYVMDTYKLNEDEAFSLLMSNPEMLTPFFGLEILLYWTTKGGLLKNVIH